MGVKFKPAGSPDTADVELTPMPMVNNAMASVHAAITNGLFNCSVIAHSDLFLLGSDVFPYVIIVDTQTPSVWFKMRPKKAEDCRRLVMPA